MILTIKIFAARMMKFMSTPITITEVLLKPENASLASNTPVTNKIAAKVQQNFEMCKILNEIIHLCLHMEVTFLWNF